METAEDRPRIRRAQTSFATEQGIRPNGNGFRDQIYNPNDLLDDLVKTSNDREDLLLTDPDDLRLGWRESNDVAGTMGRFTLSPEHLEPGKIDDYVRQHGSMSFPWAGREHRSLCRMMETTPERYRKMTGDPVQRFLNEFRAWFSSDRDGNHGLLMRTSTHDGQRRGVDGFLPGNISTLDEATIIATTMEQMESLNFDISGINVLEDHNRMISHFRIIFGDPVEGIPDRESPLHMMMDVRYSHVLSAQFQAILGLWRLICRNGMVRKDLEFMRVRWNQKDSDGFVGQSATKMFENVSEVVSLASYFAPLVGGGLKELPELMLGVDPMDLTERLNDLGLMPATHRDLVQMRLEDIDTVSPKTEYDYLNLLTQTAHDLPSLEERLNAESRALMLAMQPEAFTGVVQSGFDETTGKKGFEDLKKIRRESRN